MTLLTSLGIEARAIMETPNPKSQREKSQPATYNRAWADILKWRKVKNKLWPLPRAAAYTSKSGSGRAVKQLIIWDHFLHGHQPSYQHEMWSLHLRFQLARWGQPRSCRTGRSECREGKQNPTQYEPKGKETQPHGGKLTLRLANKTNRERMNSLSTKCKHVEESHIDFTVGMFKILAE